jgi:hypothetical protein
MEVGRVIHVTSADIELRELGKALGENLAQKGWVLGKELANATLPHCTLAAASLPCGTVWFLWSILQPVPVPTIAVEPDAASVVVESTAYVRDGVGGQCVERIPRKLIV